MILGFMNIELGISWDREKAFQDIYGCVPICQYVRLRHLPKIWRRMGKYRVGNREGSVPRDRL